MLLDQIQKFAAGNSICHRWPAIIKITLVAATIGLVMSVPPTAWPAYGLLLCWIVTGLIVAEVPLAYLLTRVRLLLPVLLTLSLAIPASHGFQSGWEYAAATVLRGLTSFLAALWLSSTTRLESLIDALRTLRVPRVLLEQLAFTCRYLSVVTDELARLRVARASRSLSPTSLWGEWRGAVQMMNSLIIRSLDRADRVHHAMLARGWSGRMPE